MLDKTLFIWGYKAGSKSALALAYALDVWCIKHEGSNFVGTSDKVILNWGSGTGYFCPNAGKAKVLNLPSQIDKAVNKLDFFKAMNGWEAPRVPHWTNIQGKAQAWVSAGYEVVARTKLEGMKGEGIVLIKSPSDFVEAHLYTIKVPSDAEYRVYCLNGTAIDSRIKVCQKGEKENPDGMRWEEKYEFCKHGADDIAPDVYIQAEKAVKKLGLFTGGVDVLLNGATGQATVLEINTAPYIGGDTADLYADGIKKFLGVK